MQQKKIILFIIILLLASSVWLFHANSRSLDPEKNSGWWAVYFTEPKSNNFDFIIENHQKNEIFRWEVLSGDEKIKEGDAKIEKGESLEQKMEDIKITDKKITIVVTNDEETKEIYKNP